MDLSLLADPLLLLIMAMAGFVTMATSLQVATRPAAVRTGLVATALTMGQLVFIVTRFGNMFYLPLLGNFVDQATRGGEAGQATLLGQIQWVVVGTALGALVALLLLPTFVELCSLGVYSIRHRGMLRALLNLRSPGAWKKAFGAIKPPGLMGTKLLALKGIPKTFLLANIGATAIWTVGALAAITVSGLEPELKQTAILLSGLVNSFAAIAFSVWVDPQAALITDQAKDERRPRWHVDSASVHLVLGNFVGCLLGLAILRPAVSLITVATKAIGAGASNVDAAIPLLILGNAFILLLNGTIYSSRVSAVQTNKVATSIAVFNFFSLIARLSGQVYGPFVGAVTDQLTYRPDMSVALTDAAAAKLLFFNRGLIGGATLGCLISVIMIPTFVQIYNTLIKGLDRHQSLPKVLLRGLHPARWGKLLATLRFPWRQHVSRDALSRIPKAFLWANVIVLGFQTVGQLAAIYAGAVFSPEVARTTTLLSPLINGIATITLSIFVDPGCATLVDEAIDGKRDSKDIETMTFWLAMGTVVGTLLSQLLFVPAAWLISQGAVIMDAVL